MQTTVELADKTPKPYQSTDPRDMEVPEHPAGYYKYLYNLVPPEGMTHDADAFMKAFADEAFKSNMLPGQAKQVYLKKQEELFGAYRTAYAKATAETREKLFKMTPLEAHKQLETRLKDKNDPYWDRKAPVHVQEQAIAEINQLYRIRAGLSDNLDEGLYEYHQKYTFPKETGSGDVMNRKTSSDPESFTQRYNSKEDGPIDGQEPNT